MRALSWIALGAVAVACGGSAFTTNDGKGGGGTSGAGASAGSPDLGGSSSAGTESAGAPGAAGDVGTAGDTATGGTPGVAGGSMGGTATAGAAAGGTETAGTSMGGTDTAGRGGMGGTSAGTGGAAGGAPPVDTTCPKLQPSKGTACKSGLKCSYGNDVRTACRNTAQCTDGAWVVTRPNCDSLNSCNNIQVGAACETGDKPCLLNADQGIYCVCTGCGAGPCTNKPTWACAAGSGGNTCPIYPPNLGSSCVGDKMCSYGSCSTANGVNAVCDGSTWSWQDLLCPL